MRSSVNITFFLIPVVLFLMGEDLDMPRSGDGDGSCTFLMGEEANAVFICLFDVVRTFCASGDDSGARSLDLTVLSMLEGVDEP